MRILLIAYEFPPSPSPQSLRWAYLCRELAALGHEIDVLTVDLGPDSPGLPELPPQIRIHRTWPGWLRGITAWSRKRNIERALAQLQTAAQSPAQSTASASKSTLNTQASAASLDSRDSQAPEPSPSDASIELPKPRRLGAVKALIWSTLLRIGEQVVFPDIRGEWLSPAKQRLRQLLRQHCFDAVICSHEPATSLQLGLLTQKHKIALLADLGDPVDAIYTPKRWKHKARRLERSIATSAAAITVTAQSAAELLAGRHPNSAPIHVVTQGFADPPATSLSKGKELFDPALLELLYTGSFYAFRRPESLIEAVLATPNARLSIATINAPAAVREAAKQHPQQIRLLGFLPHTDALALQRHADVLVNIANDDSAQVPGKLYEYAGAARPILHICQDTQDPSAVWITSHARGWVCLEDTEKLTARLAQANADKQRGELTHALDLSLESVAQYRWAHKAQQFDALLQQAIAR